jgi:hypothetical protein
MQVRKLWREIYLGLMMACAYATIGIAAVAFRDLEGLVLTAIGVFIAVLGTGLYDEWTDRKPTKPDLKIRR